MTVKKVVWVLWPSETADDNLWINKSEWEHWGQTAVFMVKLSPLPLLHVRLLFLPPLVFSELIRRHEGFQGLREFTRGQSLKDGSTPVWSQVPRHASSLIHISAINVNIRRKQPSVILPPHGIQNREQQRHIRHMFSPFSITYFSCCLLSFSPSLRHISLCFGQKTRRVFWWLIARSFYLF